MRFTYRRQVTHLLLLLVLLLAALADRTPAHAATLTVCPSGCAYSQIQPAISAAADGATITIAAGTYKGGLLIAKNITLQGAGADQTIISGGAVGASSVVTVYFVATTSLRDLTITGGIGLTITGGGINNGGTLTLANSAVSGNTSTDLGGGIFNAGTLIVENSAIRGNGAYNGAGIFNDAGTVTVTTSTFSDNHADLNGGGIANYYGGPVTVTNSTFGNNSATNGAGIFNSSGAVTLTSSTLSGNGAYYAGGIYNAGSPATVSNTIIAGNTGSGGIPDCGGGLKDGPAGHNLIGINFVCSGLTNGVNGNQVGTSSNPLDPKLGPMQDNGGPTQTMSLLPGSPAIDAAGACPPPATDQRGVARPQGPACDIGAYEVVVDQTPPTSSASTMPASPNGTSGWFTSEVTVNLSAIDNDGGSGVRSLTYTASGAQTIGATTVPGASARLTISTEGTTMISYAATDSGGNVEPSQTVMIKLDTTAPSITASAANADGTAYTTGSWTNQQVTVSFSCSDATSGVAPDACPAAVTIGAEGTTPSVSGSVSDQAGTSTSASFGPILIDTTTPTITFASRTAPNAAGWNNSAVTVNWTCSDTLSGAVRLNVSQTLSSEGANQSATGTCMDVTGNSASNLQSGINIDLSAPSAVSGAPTTSPNGTGWYTAPVTVKFNGTDATSGIASCTSASYSGPDSAAATVSGSCTDQAGNTSPALASASFRYDATAPMLAPSVSPNPVLLNSSATGSANASDATSGINAQSCASVITSSIGAKSVACSATDRAGNSASANASYRVIYSFSGFLSPVSNLPTLNQVSAGKSVALLFSLAGNQGLNVLASNFPASRLINCSTLAPLGPYQPTNAGKKGSLQYTAKTNQYTYAWTTDKAWVGTCRQFDLTLLDGTEHLANFTFIK